MAAPANPPVVSLDAVSGDDVGTVGGKGANLGELLADRYSLQLQELGSEYTASAEIRGNNAKPAATRFLLHAGTDGEQVLLPASRTGDANRLRLDASKPVSRNCSAREFSAAEEEVLRLRPTHWLDYQVLRETIRATPWLVWMLASN